MDPEMAGARTKSACRAGINGLTVHQHWNSSTFLDFLNEMDIEVDEEATDRAFVHLLPLCRDTGLTVYDAVDLDLALRR